MNNQSVQNNALVIGILLSVMVVVCMKRCWFFCLTSQIISPVNRPIVKFLLSWNIAGNSLKIIHAVKSKARILTEEKKTTWKKKNFLSTKRRKSENKIGLECFEFWWWNDFSTRWLRSCVRNGWRKRPRYASFIKKLRKMKKFAQRVAEKVVTLFF